MSTDGSFPSRPRHRPHSRHADSNAGEPKRTLATDALANFKA